MPALSSLIFVVFTIPSLLAVRINCGGDALDQGRILADTYATNAHGRYFSTDNVTNSIYDSHAWGFSLRDLTYRIPISIENAGADAPYKVRLQFAENWKGTAGAGLRVLDAYINDVAVAKSLDVWSAAGGNMFVPHDVIADQVHAKEGYITVRIASVQRNTMISGIAITPSDISPITTMTPGVGLTASASVGEAAKPAPYTSAAPIAPASTPSTSPSASSSASEAVPLETTAPDTGASSATPPPSLLNLSVEFVRVAEDYPLRVFEGQGTVLGSGEDKYLTVFGGFYQFPKITSRVYQRKFGLESAPWERLPDMPGAESAVTHMGQVVLDGDTFCGAGGFIGPDPGRSGNQFWCYHRSTKEWKHMADLPGDRAGGGLARIGKDKLLFSGGTDRERDNHSVYVDYGTTWTLDYKDPGAEWVDTNQSMPNPRNHQAAVETCGRILFVGGQHKVDEHGGNQATVSEWLVDEGKWSDTPPAELPFPLGHVSASVMAYKCGMIVVGGIGNGRTLSNKVLYWDSATDTWTQIGTYPHVVATPVCGIVEDTIMCATAGKWYVSNQAYLGKIVAT